jgi:CRP/FNR family transcriptional regulator
MHTEILCHSCPLRTSGNFLSNTVEEISYIQRFKKNQVELASGDTVILEGAAHENLYTILAGWAFRFRSLEDGRRQILCFLLPGDFIGTQDHLTGFSPFGVECLTALTLCVFPQSRMLELFATHPKLGLDVSMLCSYEQLLVEENLLSVGQHTALERMAMLLINLYKRAENVGLGGKTGVEFPLTQQHIADALGLSLVHTNKTLNKLKATGFFSINDGVLKIKNPVELKRLADYYALPLRKRPVI